MFLSVYCYLFGAFALTTIIYYLEVLIKCYFFHHESRQYISLDKLFALTEECQSRTRKKIGDLKNYLELEKSFPIPLQTAANPFKLH